MKYVAILIPFLFVSCSFSKLPEEKLSQYSLNNSYQFNNDHLTIKLGNTLRCPMRIWVQSDDDKIKAYFEALNPIVLKALTDTLIKVEIQDVAIKEIHFASRFGDVNNTVNSRKMGLPFQKNKKYRLIQGNNSLPTHNTDWSRYAFDFGMAIGDTICAASQGVVVGVVEDYKFGGRHEKWRDFANLITIYNPESGIFTQYVHLDHKGSLVELGDSVFAGQKIGIAGMTGFTNIEHLHFNCLKPIHSQDGLISILIDSIGAYKVSELKRNQMVLN